jgi:hypothetical protein
MLLVASSPSPLRSVGFNSKRDAVISVSNSTSATRRSLLALCLSVGAGQLLYVGGLLQVGGMLHVGGQFVSHDLDRFLVFL